MPVEKLSVSFDAELADVIRRAAAHDGVTVSTWLAGAAEAKARQHHLREALDEFAKEHGELSDEEITRLIAESRKNTIITRPGRTAA